MKKAGRVMVWGLAVLSMMSIIWTGLSEAQGKKEKITVAIVVPLTGDSATYGVSHKTGLELSFADINKAGGVKGQELELISYDDMGDPKQAASGAQKFADQKRVLLIAGSCLSSNTLAMIPITDKAHLPHSAVSSSAPKLSGISKYFFRMAGQDADIGKMMADIIAEKFKVKKLAILVCNNDAGKGLTAAIEGQLVLHKDVTVASKQTYLATDKDYSSLLTSIKNADVDAVAIAGQYTDAALIIKQARGIGFNKPIIGPNALYSPKFIEIGGPSVDGTYLVGPFCANNPDPKIQDFVKKYKEKYGMEPDTFAALAYDQGYVFKEALEKAAAKGGITRENIRDAMAASNYKGMTGTVTFNEKGDWVRSYLFMTVKNGKFVMAQ